MSIQTYEKNAELIEFAKTLDYVPWCEEYEKMISGMLHDENVPELVNARFRARKWMKKFNNYFPDDATPESLGADRQKMLAEVLGRLGKNSYIEPPFRIDYGANISVGEGLYANYNLCILDCGIVKLGNRVLFGPNVSLFAVTHDTEIASRRRFEDFAGYITIGDDCWIGGNAIIMPNVTIGKGCTIGAGSIVTHDVPDFSIAVGAPAKVTRKVEAVPDV